MSAVLQALGDGVVVAERNIIKIRRVPDLLVGVTLGPIMFVLLFAYVFGGSIQIPGLENGYREFLIPGIFAQSVIFGATITGSAMAQDLKSGIIDRFRSLPMSASAVLVGRTTADVIANVIQVVVMSIAGLVVGWRIRTNPLDALLGFLLLLLFAYAVSWVMAYVGMIVRSPEVFNNASFILIFPITFIAITFVPAENLPTPLRIFAEWNPVSAITQAARELFGNVPPPGSPIGEPTAWPLQNPVLYTLVWVVILLVVFIPLTIQQYKRAVSR
ncbi:MAG: ABC transporter permease [Kineosporiaceae bacterium]